MAKTYRKWIYAKPMVGDVLGPARVDDGTQNLVGALRSAMGVCGAQTLRDFQQTELVIAPAIQSEGKLFQQTQQVGMGT